MFKLVATPTNISVTLCMFWDADTFMHTLGLLLNFDAIKIHPEAEKCFRFL